MKRLLAVILSIGILTTALPGVLIGASAGNASNLIGGSVNSVDSSSFENLTIGSGLLIPFSTLDTSAKAASDQPHASVTNTLNDFTASSGGYGYWLIPMKAMNSGDKFGFASWERAVVAANPKSDSVNSSAACLNLKCCSRPYVRRIDGLKSGNKYTVSFKYYGTTSATDICVGLTNTYDANMGTGAVQFSSDGAWHTKSFQVDWSGNSTGYLQFKRNGATPSDFYVDDLSIVEITPAEVITITATVFSGQNDFGYITTPSVTVNKGSDVSFTAVPFGDYRFVGWYVGDTLVSTDAVYSFTANSNLNLVAKFSGSNNNLIGTSVGKYDSSTFEMFEVGSNMLIPINALDTSASAKSDTAGSVVTNTKNDFLTNDTALGAWIVPYAAMNGGDKFGFASWETPKVAANPKLDTINTSTKCLNLPCCSRTYVRRVTGLQAGKKYRVSFKYYGTSDAKDIHAGLVDSYDTNMGSGSIKFDCDGAWNTTDFTVTGSGNSSVYLQIKRSGSTASPLYIDDIAIKEVVSLVNYDNTSGTIFPSVDSTQIGQTITVTATAFTACSFEGWYINDYLYSKDRTTTITFAANTTYQARFVNHNSIHDGGAESYNSGVRVDSGKTGIVSSSNWVYVSEGVNWPKINTTGSKFFSGSNSYQYYGMYCYGGQYVDGLKKNTDYVLTFYSYLDTADTFASMKVVTGDCPLDFNTIKNASSSNYLLSSKAVNEKGSGGWTKNVFPFNTGNNTSVYYLLLYYSSSYNSIYLDEVAVYPSVYVSAATSKGGTISGFESSYVMTNEEVSLTAVPLEGNKFVGWYDTNLNKIVSVNDNYSFTATKTTDLVAKFSGDNMEPRELLGLNSFENDRIGNWRYYYDSSDPKATSWCSVSKSTEKAYSGKHSAALYTRSRDSILTFNQTISENTNYVLSFYLYLENYQSFSHAYVSADNTGFNSSGILATSDVSSYAGNGNWRKITIRFNSGSNTILFFGCQWVSDDDVPGYTAYMDNLELIEYDAESTISNGEFDQGSNSWHGKVKIISDSDKFAEIAAENCLYKYLKVSNNGEYKVTFKAKSPNNSTLLAGVYNGLSKSFEYADLLTSYSYETVTNTAWSYYTVSFFSADQDFVKLVFYNLGDSSVYIDSVSFVSSAGATDGRVECVDFENGRYQINGNSQIKNYSICSDSAYVHSGNHSLRYIYTANEETALNQEWCRFKLSSLSPFKYTLSMYVKFADGTSSFHISPDRLNQYLGQSSCIVKASGSGWSYVEYQFVNDLKVPSVDFVLRNILDKTKCDVYFDDITIKVTTAFVTKSSLTETYCEDFYNLIPNSSFEKAFTVSDWKTIINQDTHVMKGSAATGTRHLRIFAGEKYIMKIPVSTLSSYSLAASLRCLSGSTGYVGLTYDSDGKLFLKNTNNVVSSLINAKSAKWVRNGFSVTSGSYDTVYLVLECKTGQMDVDALNLFGDNFSYGNDPNNYTTLVKFDYMAFKNQTDTNPGTGDSSALMIRIAACVAILSLAALTLSRKRRHMLT